MPQFDPNTSAQALAAQNTAFGAVLGRLGLGNNGQGLLGRGMAQGAAQQLQMQPQYKTYAEQEIIAGRQPLSADQWMQQMQSQRPMGQ